MLVDATKITIVLDSALNVDFVELDACRLLQVGLLCDLGTPNLIVLAAEKALPFADGTAGFNIRCTYSRIGDHVCKRACTGQQPQVDYMTITTQSRASV